MLCLSSYLGHELLFPWFAYPRWAKSIDRWRIFRKDVKFVKARPGARRGDRWSLTNTRFHYAALASSGCENSIDRTGHRTDTRPRWALALWCAGSCVSTMARTSSMRSCTLDRDPASRPRRLTPQTREHVPSQQFTPPGAPPGLKPSGLKVS